MKRSLKSLLHTTGLLGPAQKIYFNAKTVSPDVLRREVSCRRDPPDGFPIPPGRLIFEVIACHWAAVYYDSGARIVDDMQEILSRNDLSLGQFEAILDFGCGCGRLLRHVHPRTGADLHGTDLNDGLVAWSQKHLPFARFAANELDPPLSYEDQTFDFIYARSVFTHLPETLQQAWIRELRRLLCADGYLYLTMHGRRMSGGLTDEQRARLTDQSFFQIFSFDLLHGNPKTVLTEPNSVVLTHATASRYFGTDNPIGQMLTLREGPTLRVTGVTENPPSNSHLTFDFLASFSTLDKPQRMDHQGFAYFLLSSTEAAASLKEKLTDLTSSENEAIVEELGFAIDEMAFELQPLTSIHLYDGLDGAVQAQSDIRYLYIFGALGPTVFLLAGGIALGVAFLTVSYQSIKAALTNPADSLRYE